MEESLSQRAASTGPRHSTDRSSARRWIVWMSAGTLSAAGWGATSQWPASIRVPDLGETSRTLERFCLVVTSRNTRLTVATAGWRVGPRLRSVVTENVCLHGIDSPTDVTGTTLRVTARNGRQEKVSFKQVARCRVEFGTVFVGGFDGSKSPAPDGVRETRSGHDHRSRWCDSSEIRHAWHYRRGGPLGGWFVWRWLRLGGTGQCRRNAGSHRAVCH